jgi:hypothetical protein
MNACGLKMLTLHYSFMLFNLLFSYLSAAPVLAAVVVAAAVTATSGGSSDALVRKYATGQMLPVSQVMQSEV